MESELYKIEKLQNSEDYALWKFQVTILLNASECSEIVTGEEPFPIKAQAEAQEAFDKRVHKWKKNDSKAQRILATTVGTTPLRHIMTCSTAAEMWRKLKAVYEQTSQSSVHMLQQRFYSFTKDPGDDVATHISKLKNIVKQLKDIGEEVSESMVITKILMTLPSSFSHFFSAWESATPDQQTLENLTSRLVMEEARMSMQSTHLQESTNALVTQRKQTGKQGKALKRGKCYICHEPGHWKRDCPSRKETFDYRKAGNERRTQKREALTCSAFSSNTENHNDVWYLDSGASDHMTFRKEWLVCYRELKEPMKVRIGSGEIIPAVGIGDVKILAFDGKMWNEKYLSNVLFVPKITMNLFSQSRALDKGFKLISDNKCCKFIRKNDPKTIVAMGERLNQLFKMYFKVQEAEERIANTAVGEVLSLRLWHERMAHLNIIQVRNMLNQRNIKFKDIENFTCDTCNYGKQHRNPFGRSVYRAEKQGDLVHADVCGAMEVASLGESRYFVLFKDHFSHFRVVFFIKRKSEVCAAIEKFLNIAKIDSKCSVKTLRTDNGLEFVNDSVKRLLDEHSIRHETTVPYTPEQNGCAERENRTIVEAARCMLHGKELSKSFWAEAVNVAVYTLNRIGSSPAKGKSPYELWCGKLPSITDLKVFGAKVFVHVPKQKRRKWDQKANKGIFIGYQEGTKGYKIWIPSSRKIVISRDVVFRETAEQVDNCQDVRAEASKEIFVLPASEYMHNNENVTQNSISDGAIFEQGDSDTKEDEFQSADDDSEDRDCIREDVLKEEVPLKNRLRSAKTKEKASMYSLLERHAFIVQGEPQTYDDAVSSDDSVHWKAAMEDEMNSLKTNHTWDLTNCPENRKVVQSKWVFKLKELSGNQRQKYKARLVARGFTQEYGIDYAETFSPVVKYTSIRTILAISANENLNLTQFDVKTAFLNGKLSEEIYMSQPQGFDDGSGRVCRLRKSLYGLKQAPRCWNQRFSEVLKKFKLKPSKVDPCVFISDGDKRRIILAIYVDDGLMATKDEADAQALIAFLKQHFDITVLSGEIFLGMEIKRTSANSIHVCQEHYIERVLQRFNMDKCKAVTTPMEKQGSSDSSQVIGSISFPFREAVGSLIYLAVLTRPDIAFAVGVVSRYVNAPTPENVNAVKRILKYISGTRKMGILFKTSANFTLTCFSDADYGGDVKTRRSTTGFIFMLGNGSVSWLSQRQKCVSLSTTKSEYVAASQAVKEMVWLKTLLMELTASETKTATLNMDNQGAIRLVKNPEFHQRTKHIDVRYHFIRERYEQGDFDILYVPSDQQKADILTKPLTKDKFEKFRSLIGIGLLN